VSYLNPHTHHLDGPDADGSPRPAPTRPVSFATSVAVTLDALLGFNRPRIVCLCGSTRFKAEFEQVAAELTLTGVIVVKPDVFMNDGHAEKEHLPAVDAATKVALDDIHKRKIDLADEVLVLNVGGYVGDSTRSEIAYAEQAGKPVRYLETADSPVAK
jgi:hypothetical protein